MITQEYPYLSRKSYYRLTREEILAISNEDFWDAHLSVDDVYEGTY